MERKIIKTSLGNYLEITLNKNENIYTQPGSLISIKGDVEVKSTLGYGLSGLIFRPLGGESPFINQYKAKKRSKIEFGPKSMSEIASIKPKNKLIVKDGAYLAHTGNIKIGAKFGGITSIAAGSGIFFMTFEGDGEIFIEGNRLIKIKVLKKGESIIIDNTSFLAADDSVEFITKTLGDTLITKIFGGEGLVFKIKGPGRVIYQGQSKGYLQTLIERWLSSE